jgi:hypothetical protein
MPRRDAEEGVGCDEAAAAVRLADKKIRKRRELSVVRGVGPGCGEEEAAVQAARGTVPAAAD